MNLLFLRAENGFRSLYKNICLYHSYYNGFFEPLSLWFASSQRNRYTKDILDRGGSTKHTIFFLALRRMVGWIRFFFTLKPSSPPKEIIPKNISSYELVVFEANRQANWLTSYYFRENMANNYKTKYCILKLDRWMWVRF